MTGKGSLALALLAAVLGLAGLAATYVKLELAEPEPFAERSVEALRSEAGRTVIAEQVAVELLERGSPDLVASRPLVLAAVEALLESDEISPVLRRSAVTAHKVLFRGDRDVIVELEEAREALVPAVESASPKLARQIPADLSPRIAEIRASDAATSTIRLAEDARAVSVPLLIAAGLALLIAVALAADRRRALATTGLVLAGAAGLGILAMAALRAQVLSHVGEVGVLSEDDARAAAGAGWDALAGSLEDWLRVSGIVALAVAGGAFLAEARVDRAAALQQAAVVIGGGRPPRVVRLLRGLLLAALAVLILARVEPVFATVIAVLGGAFALLGLAEALSTVGRSGEVAIARPRHRRRRQLVAGVAAALFAIGLGVALLSRGGPPAPPESAEIRTCNGLQALCDRRLDQVAFAGTHNSMAAANRPGWFFANQVRPIPRQLEDGIRLLMIDPHYGVVDSQGRVRTDLRAEGTTRNRVARRLGREAVGAAERLGGRLGLVPAEGEREVFLCHTLCELGAERMSSTLDELRGFLERNRSEVLVVFIESSVDPDNVEEQFEEAELGPYLASLRRDEPLPTLRQMIASGRRLVVFDEGDGGDSPWYQPGFLFVEDTRIRSLLRSRTACESNRGSPESPLLLMNHWIDRFPPPASDNREVSQRRTLLRRVRSCRDARGNVPNLIGVDFYEQGDVIPAVRELNRQGAAARE